MKRQTIILIFLFAIYVFVSCFIYVKTTVTNIENSVFRLHIIANSDSVEDQNLKYKVRDNIISYMDTLCRNSHSKDETISIVKAHINDFQQIANNTITENGYNYSSEAQVGNFEFPTKFYGDISLPSGYYDALEIKLGDSSGQNWWCVLYPSLCFVDVSSGELPDSSKEELQNVLSEEQYSLISENTSTYNFKFKLVELFNTNFKISKSTES